MEQFDNESIYCRKLGHWLTFNYCRRENKGFPCRGIISCWFERIEIEKFLKENYEKGEISYLFEPQPSKLASIIELIEDTKRRNECNS
ncbi:MAG: hypothetical protein ABIN61_08215 [candidate division WOR-3 bacterium]